jgi:hypothetical protein
VGPWCSVSEVPSRIHSASYRHAVENRHFVGAGLKPAPTGGFRVAAGLLGLPGNEAYIFKLAG